MRILNIIILQNVTIYTKLHATTSEYFILVSIYLFSLQE